MKFSGELTVKAPRPAVFDALRDARFFASCVEGVRDLAEIGPDRYAAVFETKVAYMKFSFKVTVELVRADPPRDTLVRHSPAGARRSIAPSTRPPTTKTRTSRPSCSTARCT